MDLKALNICRICGIGLRDQPCRTFSCSLGVSFENFRRPGCLRVMVLTPPVHARAHVPQPVPRSFRTIYTDFTTSGLIRIGRVAATCNFNTCSLIRYLLMTLFLIADKPWLSKGVTFEYVVFRQRTVPLCKHQLGSRDEGVRIINDRLEERWKLTISMMSASEALSLKNVATSSGFTPCSTLGQLSLGAGSEGMYASQMAVIASNWVALRACVRGGVHCRSAGWPCMITDFLFAIPSVLTPLDSILPSVSAISVHNYAF